VKTKRQKQFIVKIITSSFEPTKTEFRILEEK